MQTTGKAKFAERMGDHLNEPIEAACPITRPGGTARQIGGSLGGVAGAVIASADNKNDSDARSASSPGSASGPLTSSSRRRR
jgi:hypothetical protein